MGFVRTFFLFSFLFYFFFYIFISLKRRGTGVPFLDTFCDADLLFFLGPLSIEHIGLSLSLQLCAVFCRCSVMDTVWLFVTISVGGARHRPP